MSYDSIDTKPVMREYMFDLFESPRFLVHGSSEHDGVSGALDFILTGIHNLLHLPSGEVVNTLFPGISAMANLHPLFVHFPIALLSIFFLIDLSGSVFSQTKWRHTASWFLYLGTIFAGLTVLVGFHAADTVAHGEDVHEIMETHEHLGVTIFCLTGILSVWRLIARSLLQGVANILYLFFAGVLSILLIFTADLGGLMVYKYGVAVAATSELHGESYNAHHHEHSD